MQIRTEQLMATPRDEEEDNLALLCFEYADGEMFMLTRFPDEDELEITLDEEQYRLRDVKVTLAPQLLRIEVADAEVFGGDLVLDISHSTADGDMPEVIETLRIVLDGVGTLVGGDG
ncbi:hypothetical protein [Pseudomonas sp. nanlin1]|uniref:hypothetical protein n=1 Tax=Pseudomonas sp. nanlin1 TaxID=3040605 RepID=UPI00388E7DF9